MSRYDYEELKKAAESGKKEDIDRLGRWFEEYGTNYWNGECYDVEGRSLYPIYKEIEFFEDQFEVVGYEFR